MPATKLKCVFVHGWGMNRQVWQPLIDELPEWVEAVSIDLPGHGLLADQAFKTLDDVVECLQVQVKQPAVWIAWSLGGLAVCQLALQRPEQVIGMMQVSSSPCFTQRDNWSVGIDERVFEQFEHALQNDFSATIQRFLALQMRGSENNRLLLRELRQNIANQPMPQPQALTAGLCLLKDTDLRAQLKSLRMPLAWVLGQQDSLVKSSLINELKILVPEANLNVIEQAAHAPFLSHLTEFKQHLLSFLKPLKKTLI